MNENKIKIDNDSKHTVLPMENIEIKNMIYTIREQQVMLDEDLAVLYQTETRILNQAVKRNIRRFPEMFRFQLTKEEMHNLISQNVISSSESDNGYGGRRTLPYAFTEQGIAMLSAVLKSDVAVQVSIRIMSTFVEMRHFIVNNALMFERISSLELRQLAFQQETNEKFDQVFEYISKHEAPSQKIFFDGQIYDAFSLICGLIRKASEKIILIDGYIDTVTLDLLSKKQKEVSVKIYTSKRGHALTKSEISKFNAQYSGLCVKYTNNFHDRFLILDDTIGYHIGASIKDAGKKCFGITRIEDLESVQNIIERLTELQ